MELNVTLIVLFISALLGLYWGWGKGFAKCVSNFLASIATIITLIIFMRIYHSYTGGQTVDTIKAVIVLVIFGAIYGLLNFVIKSAKTIANLPVISVIDSIFGALLGLLIVFALYHLIVEICSLGYIGDLGAYILNDIENDQWLTFFAQISFVQLVTMGKEKVLELIGSI